jgi:hypothetical protein
MFRRLAVSFLLATVIVGAFGIVTHRQAGPMVLQGPSSDLKTTYSANFRNIFQAGHRPFHKFARGQAAFQTVDFLSPTLLDFRYFGGR